MYRVVGFHNPTVCFLFLQDSPVWAEQFLDSYNVGPPGISEPKKTRLSTQHREAAIALPRTQLDEAERSRIEESIRNGDQKICLFNR